MDVVSLCPLRATSFVWRPASGRPRCTVVCKATFRLAPGQSQLADEQDPPNEHDDHWDDDPARSVFAATDLAPAKARADVVLVGYAFAPHEQPVRSLLARLIVGNVDKSIEVVCDRTWVQGDLRAGAPFRKMPLAYERAAGGPDTWNPTGVRVEGRTGRLPNLQPPGLGLSAAPESILPVGFGPIAPSWPTRVQKLGRYAATWSHQEWEQHPLPADFDVAYFNVAPPDQQLDGLRGDEAILLEGLLSQHARLVTRLPSLRPRAIVSRGDASRELTLVCDTLCIDTDRGVAALTWRGQFRLDHAEEGQVVVSMVEGVEAARDQEAAAALGLRAALLSGDDEEPESIEPDELGGATAAVPAATLGVPVVPESERRAPVATTAVPAATVAVQAVDLRRVMPFVPSAGTPPAGLGAPRDSSPGLRPVDPMGDATGPLPAAAPIGPPVAQSPWAAGVDRSSADRLSDGLPFTPERAAESQSFAGDRASELPPISVERSTAPPSTGGVRAAPAALASAAAASDAAASSPWSDTGRNSARDTIIDIQPVMQRVRPRDLFDLLWFDPAAAPRAKKKPAWKELVDGIENQAADPDLDGEKVAVDSRRELFEVVAKADPTDALGVEDSLVGAIRGDGKFVPPLVLVAGELRFSFDDRERLKVLALLAGRHASSDKKLKEAVDAATEALSDAALTSASGVPSALVARIEDALPQRGPAADVTATCARMLLEGRHFAKRPVLGGQWIRCALDAGGGKGPLVVYLPEDLGPKLPLFQRFSARLLAEVHVRQDEVETQPCALRACALVRVVTTAWS